ncbi:DUF1361 domain-containing protein [Pontimicrobium sp. SW4]|uniref:DUF1361 domain-containing protein n=1 Tax=Pontimicrobium sp. SW4 TaxID=3153519 RepID=A0AAU7BQ54_9FLAO
MTNLKTLINSRFQLLTYMALSMMLSGFLLLLRVKLNQSFYYLFLVWNLFLAFIPFCMTLYLKSKTRITKTKLLAYFTIWLLFLPNAPYIITDLLHFKRSTSTFLWLDILMVTSFTINGLVLFHLTLLDMETLLRKFISIKKTNFLFLFVFFLTGFGMYLGRFLRFNSWDILQHPDLLINNIWEIISNPNQHFEAWTFTFCFGVFLGLTYKVVKTLKQTNF